MNTKPKFSTLTVLLSLVVLSVIAAACAPATKPAPTPVAIKPTAVPTRSLPTATAQPKPTATPKVAPTVAATATPAVKAVPIGQAQIMSAVSILPSKYEWLPQSGSDQPKAGDQYLVITFSIENTSKTANFDFDPANLVILNPAGTALSMVSLKSLTNELTMQTLKPGAKLDGVIAYELP